MNVLKLKLKTQKLSTLDNLSDVNITKAFKLIKPTTPVLLIGQLTSSKHNKSLMTWNESTSILSATIPNPVFTIFRSTIEYGAVGAHELSAYQHAKKVSVLIKQILQGEPVSNIMPIKKQS